MTAVRQPARRPDARPQERTPSTPTGAFGYPVFLDLRGRRVLVAGGGREPAGKVPALLACGARVTLWAATHAETRIHAATEGVDLLDGPFDPRLLDGAAIAIVATGGRALDRSIATAARERGVLVNTVDDIPFCDWSAPAILRRGDLTIAIGTGGVAPALAVRLRDRAAADVGPEHGELLALFGEVRPRIMASGRPFADRRRLWYGLVDGPAVAHLRAGDADAARRAIDTTIAGWEAER